MATPNPGEAATLKAVGKPTLLLDALVLLRKSLRNLDGIVPTKLLSL
jgi:hypothetical protein